MALTGLILGYSPFLIGIGGVILFVLRELSQIPWSRTHDGNLLAAEMLSKFPPQRQKT